MKIAHILSTNHRIPPDAPNGRVFLAQTLIEHQIKSGFAVSVFANSASTINAKRECITEITTQPNDMYGIKQKNVFYSNFLLLQKLYQRADEFDIIHSHFDLNHVFFTPFVKTPTVSTMHWPLSKQIESVISQFTQQNFSFVPISNAQIKGKQAPFTQVVYNGIDMGDYIFRQEPGEYLLFFGRITKNKGPHVAIEVAKKTGEKLKMAGKIRITEQEFFNTELQPLIDGKKISFLQKMLTAQQKSDLLRHAKALLFPISWEEPFGLVMTEAMACGTPVIAFRRGSVPEIVKHGKTGFVVDTVDEMVEAVKKIDTIDRVACRKRVEDLFSVEKMVQGYEEVYTTIIDQRRKAHE